MVCRCVDGGGAAGPFLEEDTRPLYDPPGIRGHQDQNYPQQCEHWDIQMCTLYNIESVTKLFSSVMKLFSRAESEMIDGATWQQLLFLFVAIRLNIIGLLLTIKEGFMHKRRQRSSLLFRG